MAKQITSIDGHAVPVAANEVAGSDKVCIFAHGITMDKTEGGLFDRAAAALNAAGISTLQLDFRGHGKSPLASQAMTIRGEIFDLTAVIESAREFAQIYVVAASFGAVSTGLLPENVMSKLHRICLWYPVLSLTKTFLEPEFDWQKNNFGRQRIRQALSGSGELPVGDRFVLGAGFLQEIEIYGGTDLFEPCRCPVLVLHGDHDRHVSCDIAKDFCGKAGARKFVPVPGSAHGFGHPVDEAFALSQTKEFLTARR